MSQASSKGRESLLIPRRRREVQLLFGVNIMENVNFDTHAADYNSTLQKQLSFFDQNDTYFAEYKISIVKERLPYAPERILEYGCGVGRNLRPLKEAFPKAGISGCDISKDSLKYAQEHSFATLYLLGQDLIREKFDLVFVSCVFHHIDPVSRKRVAAEIHRLLDDDGDAFVFEHNPHNPVTRRLVDRCPFDAGAVLLTCRELERLFSLVGFATVHCQYTLFIPSRFRVLRPIEKWLGWLPLGGQYCVHFKK
jgi:SAM-dependent methyltransferase